MEKKRNFLGIPRKQGNLFIFFLLLVLIIPSFFYKGLIETYWPYLIMLLVLLLMNNINDVKFGASVLITLLAFMFIMQALFYFILPVYNNYQPIPTLPKMQIFNLAGKFQVSYYPDIPKGGDNVQLYLRVCDVGLTNCSICKVCNLTSSFINENDEARIIFQNKSTNSTEPIQFSYPGRRVKVELNFEGIDPRYEEFFIPKLNFYQSVIYFFSENPFFRIVSIISLILFLIGFPYSLYKFFILMKTKFIQRNEKELKSKIEKILKDN